jgi:hypothetical protein
MTIENWLTVAAFVIPVVGSLCVAAYNLIKLMIKSSVDDAEIRRLKDKITRLQDQIKEMN